MAGNAGAPYNGSIPQGAHVVRVVRSLIPAILTAGLLFVTPAGAAEQVTVERESQLYAEPNLDSAKGEALAQGTLAEVIGKSGAWLNVKTPEATGWVFSFNVRFIVKGSDATPASSGSGGSAIGRIFGPGRGVDVTSTIGVRGLDTEDLKQAQFSAEQIKLLDGYVVAKDAAEEAARGKGLAPVEVEYLQAGSQ